MKISDRYKNISAGFRRYTASPAGMPEINRNLYGSHGSYKQQLFDKGWLEKRQEILNRDTHRCRNCGSSNDLEVHHRQYHYVASENVYKEPWDYPSDLLITLCKACSQQGRNKYKIPIKIV